MIKPWEKIGSHPVGDFRIFTIRSDQKISPCTGKEHDFYVIDSVNWVNVIALTPEQEMVLVEQYRHGSDTIELEIPGGMMDAAERSPVVTGLRELREETGYEGENARVLDQVWANPAIMSNICYTIIVENCHCLHECNWDHGEDLITRLVPVSEISKLVAEEKIRHPLVVAGLYHFDLLRRGLKKI